MLKLSEWWKDFASDSNDNIHNIPLLRKLGFAGVLLVDFIINANFYKSIADVWIMPLAGIILVFMKVWHWVSAQKSPKGRARLHYFTWGSLATMSILAAVSYGVAVTNFTNIDVEQQLAMRGIATNATTLQLNSWVEERTNLNTTIKKLNENLASYSGDRADWNKSKAADQTSLQQATTRAADLDKLIAEASTKASSSISTKALVNAQTVFSNIFGNSATPFAIKIFFVMFGLGIELTLALSSLPLPHKATTGQQLPVTLPEIPLSPIYASPAPVEKPKRKYAKRKKIREETIGTGASTIIKEEKAETSTGIPERVIPAVPVSEQKILEESDIPVREVISPEERYLIALYDSVDGLKDKFEAGSQVGLNRVDTQKIWDFLTSVNGPDGNKFIKFRPDNSKWYPCYPLNQIVNLIRNKQIQIL